MLRIQAFDIFEMGNCTSVSTLLEALKDIQSTQDDRLTIYEIMYSNGHPRLAFLYSLQGTKVSTKMLQLSTRSVYAQLIQSKLLCLHKSFILLFFFFFI